MQAIVALQGQAGSTGSLPLLFEIVSPINAAQSGVVDPNSVVSGASAPGSPALRGPPAHDVDRAGLRPADLSFLISAVGVSSFALVKVGLLAACALRVSRVHACLQPLQLSVTVALDVLSTYPGRELTLMVGRALRCATPRLSPHARRASCSTTTRRPARGSLLPTRALALTTAPPSSAQLPPRAWAKAQRGHAR